VIPLLLTVKEVNDVYRLTAVLDQKEIQQWHVAVLGLRCLVKRVFDDEVSGVRKSDGGV
jgi:hypothetical protein